MRGTATIHIWISQNDDVAWCFENVHKWYYTDNYERVVVPVNSWATREEITEFIRKRGYTNITEVATYEY